MKHANRRGGRFAAIALVGIFILGLAPSSHAGESAGAPSGPSSTLAAVAAAKVASLDLNRSSEVPLAAQAATAPEAADNSGFFKSGKGKTAITLFVVAAGATLYSKYHDRVKSGIR